MSVHIGGIQPDINVLFGNHIAVRSCYVSGNRACNRAQGGCFFHLFSSVKFLKYVSERSA